MFDKKLPEPPKKDIETILEASVDVKGNLKSEGNVKIDGKLIGDVNIGGHLILGDPAEVRGNINAYGATISGTVTGNVKVKTLLELTETAKIVGDIDVAELKVAEGALLIGECIMPEPKPEAPVSQTLPKEEKKVTPVIASKEIKKEKIKIEPGHEV